ncbi:MAG TPA: hypothetical protein VFA20_19735 [Myxococcaceae bacterium]|nr:hypothetical protein [Myxococcaceae bacterium]
MKRAWPLAAVGLALLACWDFEGQYQRCLDTGRCSDGGGGRDGGDGGDGGGGDAGDGGGGTTCPTGAPTGNGLCLVARYDRRAPMYGIYAASPDQIFFGGHDEAVSTWSGGALQDGVTGLLNGYEMADLSGTAPNAIWAALITLGSSSDVYRYDGSQWRDVMPGAFTGGDCRGVWSEDPAAAWLACDQGIYQVTSAGGIQRVNTSTSIAFNGVWGLPGGTAWAVGGDSTAGTANIWERRSGTWRGIAFVGEGVLKAVHGRNDHDVWAVGQGPSLMHLDDAGWQSIGSALAGSLQDVFAASDGETWITAGSNRVMVISPDGGQRTFVPPGVPGVPGSIFLQQVQVFDTGDVWFTGVTDDGGTELNGLEMHYVKL